MSHVSSFAAVVGGDPRVLILGSMPGTASLERSQYYAHPRNAYWPIMGDLFDAGPELAYEDRLRRLVDRNIALWDVLESCFRPGSLDSNIADETVLPNDFVKLFAENPTIRYVFFNGRKAANVFRRRVMPDLEEDRQPLVFRTLPSTSPAHASRSYEQKLHEWLVVKEVLDRKS